MTLVASRADVVALAAALDCRSAEDVVARLSALSRRAEAITTDARALHLALKVLPGDELHDLALRAASATEAVHARLDVTCVAVERQL